MKKTIYLIIALLVGLNVSAYTNPVEPIAQENEPIEEGALTWFSFDEGYAKAVKEGKILLVDAYTDWCGWCKVMDKKTYTDASVVDYLNQHFVCVKLNPELEKEYRFADKTMRSAPLLNYLGQGQVSGYPTTIFWLNPSNEEKRYVQPGFLGPEDFLGLLKSAQAEKVKKS